MTVIIGIDPHKATHVAVAIDGDELQLATPRAQALVLLARCQRAWILRPSVGPTFGA
jgi:hypothetical protein